MKTYPNSAIERSANRKTAPTLILFCVLAAINVFAQSNPSYTVSLPVGSFCLIANQLDHGSNTADILFPNPEGVRDFDEIKYNYNCADGSSTTVVFDSSQPTGFADENDVNPVPAPVLSPGAGFFYFNNGGSGNSIDFTGTPHVPVLPVSLPCGFGSYYLLSRQTNDLGDYTNVTGYFPQEGSQVLTWNVAGQYFVTNTFSGGAWTLGEPSLAVGEAAEFFIPSGSVDINGSLVYQGLTNTSLGSATLALSSNKLTVSNLGSSGQDGVSISLPTNLTGVVVGFEDPDALGTEPAGAYLQSQALGTVNGTSNVVLATLTATKLGTTNYSLSADFSALGASTYSVQLYSHGVLVGQSSGQSSAAGMCYIQKNPPKLDLEWPIWIPSEPILADQEMTVTWNNTALLQFAGTTQWLTGDHLVLTPNNSVLTNVPTAFQLVVSQIPTLAITSENISAAYQGLVNTSLGNAALAVSGSQLVVSNLGSSGQDGVNITLPANLSSLDVQWQSLDPSNALPVGAYVQEQIIGTAGQITNGLLGTVTMTKLCGNCDDNFGSNYVISADFSPIGASTFTVQAYQNGTLVAQATNQPGASLAYCSIWGDSGCIPPIPPVLGGGWDWTNESVTIGTSASLSCDHLYIIPEGVSGTPTAFQLTASQVPTITVIGETPSFVQSCVTPPTNLVLWLPFDETNGATSANLASTINSGSQVGGPGVVFGAYVDNSLSFNGVNQHVAVPDYPAIEIGTNDLTIDAWVNRATNSGNGVRVIVDKRDINTGVGYSLSVSYGNLIFTMSGNNFRDSGIVPADGQWHFVGVSLTRNSNLGQFYVDGNATGTFTPVAGSLFNTNSFWVGASPLSGNSPWLGDLDEVELFNRSLAESELAAIFNAGPYGKCKPSCVSAPANLAMWLPFDETTGNSSANLASSSNYGTHVNGPSVVTNAYVANSLSFNGVNQYVSVPDYSAIEIGTNDLTLDAWVSRATNSGNQVRIIVDKRDVSSGVGYSLSVSYGNLIFTMSGNNFRDTGTVPADGQWHFVGVSLNRSSNLGQFYVDGDPTGTFTPIVGSLSNTNLLWVGASPLGGNSPWLGGLDEVEVFNRALAADELATIFNAGIYGKCKPDCYLEKLTLTHTGTSVVLTWPGGGTLLQASKVTGPWTPVAGASSPYTIPLPLATAQFYKLECDY